MTSWSGFTRARARDSWGLLATLLALVAVTTAIITGTVGYSQAAAITAARGALTQGEPTESGVQVQTRLAEDPERQDGLAREAVSAAFDPAPVAIGRQVVSEPQSAQRDGSPLDGRLVLMAGPELAPGAAPTDLVQVADGTWPAADGPDGSDPGAPAQGVLHVGAATAWQVEVGDVLGIGDRTVQVVGTWLPVDARDAMWFADPLVASGLVDQDHGPLLVDEAVVRATGNPFVRWQVRPDPTSVAPDDLTTLAGGAETLRGDLMEVEGLTVRGVSVDGDLAPTAGTAATNLATARALGVVPLSVLVLVTGLALSQLARLLTTTREPQAQLLVARGASRGQILLTGLIETAVVALAGALIGTLLAWGVLQLLPAGDLVTRTVLTTAGMTLLGILLVLVAVAALQARRLAGGQAVADRSGRARAATNAATAALVLAAAGLAWWQLHRAGSPVLTRADGTRGTDLVAALAPALLLAAAAVLALALLGPLARATELATRASRAQAGHLAAAQVSRRLQVYAVPVVLTVLATGATTLAGLYAGTSAQLRDDIADVIEGAPLRADLVRPPATVTPGLMPPPPTELEGVPEVERSVLVWRDESTRVGDTVVPLTLARSTDLGAVAARPSGQDAGLVPPGLDQAEMADAGSPAGPGLLLPAGTDEITVEVEVELFADRWELARLAGIGEGMEQQVAREAEIYADLPEEQRPPPELLLSAQELTLEQLQMEQQSFAAERQLEVTLRLRDVRTGMAAAVGGGRRSVGGVALTWDDANLADVEVAPSTSTGTVTFTLPEGRDHLLEGVSLQPPTVDRNADLFVFGDLTYDVRLRAHAGGHDLFGDGTADWASRRLALRELAAPYQEEADAVETPEVTTVVETSGGGLSTHITSNAVTVPPWLDTSAATWHLRASDRTLFLEPGTSVAVSPGTTPADPAASLGQPPAPDVPTGTVPVALTPSAASAAALTVGDDFTLTYAGNPLPARLSSLVPAVPGQTGALAALADSDAVAAVLATTQRSLPWPSQVWAVPTGYDPADGPATAAPAVDALSAREDLGVVTGPGTVDVTDATSAARLVFWVASAGAVLLALTGIAAVAATLTTGRRPEVAVLRALGMPSGSQALSRGMELVGVVVAAVGLGLLAGYAVGRVVVPALGEATTAPGGLTLPAVLRLDTLPWGLLLVAGGLVLLALALLIAARVRGQALDATYREEVR